jgi:hypothetical protein
MKRLVAVALVVTAIVATFTGSSQARAQGGGPHGTPPGHAGGRSGAQHGFVGRPGFVGHPGIPQHRVFAGHRGFHRGGGGVIFLGAPVIVGPAYGYGYVYSPPAYAPPTVYYYCPSYGGYYPDVPACPDEWVPVPAQ